MKTMNYILGVGILIIIGILAYLFWNEPIPDEPVLDNNVVPTTPCEIMDCTQGK